MWFNRKPRINRERSKRMIWLAKQWEWLKGFFDEDDKATYVDEFGHNPSHKNLIGIAMIIIFAVAFLKDAAYGEDVPDIPAGWQLVILGILGIRALQSGVSSYVKSKNGNGNGSNGNGTTPNGDSANDKH